MLNRIRVSYMADAPTAGPPASKSGNGRRPAAAERPGKRLRVLVVDDHDVVHWGFRGVLADEPWVELHVSAQSTEEAVELAARDRPHVAAIDVVLGRESGIEAARLVRDASPGTRVLLMTASAQVSREAALGAGAFGLVPKGWPARDLAHAVRMVGLGMTLFAPAADGAPAALSDRERQVLAMIAAGSTNKEIAARLILSPHTVKDHTSALYRKIGARNRSEAIVRAQRLGLLA